MADTKVSALTELSVPDFNDDLYIVDDTGPTSNKLGTDRLFGLGGFIPGGRLTLTTGVPVTTADVTAAGTLYYTPYLHDRIRIYDGTRWRYYTFTERSLALTLTSGKNYDVFIYDNAGTLTLELSAAWTTDTARADALTTQDAVQVKSGATTRLWLGTIRASAANATEDSAAKRFVWNTYNPRRRHLVINDTTDQWTYTISTWRQANANAANQAAFVLGRIDTLVNVHVQSMVYNNANPVRASVGVGLDSTSVNSANLNSGASYVANNFGQTTASYIGYPGIGYHFLAWLERSEAAGTTSWYGDDGATTGWLNAGIVGSLEG